MTMTTYIKLEMRVYEMLPTVPVHLVDSLNESSSVIRFFNNNWTNLLLVDSVLSTSRKLLSLKSGIDSPSFSSKCLYC